MKIHYLGTSAAEGWPALFCNCENCSRARELGGKNIRSRPQALIDGCLLMDLGPDTFYHAATYNLKLWELDAVLVTHSHTDHYYSSETLLKAAPYSITGKDNPLQIYGNTNVQKMYEYTRTAEDDSIDFKDCVKFHLIEPMQPFETERFAVEPLAAAHDKCEPCVIYDITAKKDGKRMLYANDTGRLPQQTVAALVGRYFHLISMDCTMGKDASSYSHMGIDDCIATKNQLIELGCADENTVFTITHFSHNGALLHHELEEYVKQHNIVVAYDGLILEV